MDSSSITILNMEASCLITQSRTWFNKHIGVELQYFMGNPLAQPRLLDISLRFTSTVIAALDFNLSMEENMSVVKEFLAKSAYMVEIMAKNYSNKDKDKLDTTATNMRTRFQNTLRLFRFLISNEYIAYSKANKPAVLEGDYLVPLGAQSLCIWGESLISYSESCLKFWKNEHTSALRLAESVLVKCLALEPKTSIAQYYLGRAFVAIAKAITSSSPTYIGTLQKGKQAFLNAVQLYSVKSYQYGLIRVCALLEQEEECRCLLQAMNYADPTACFALLDEPDLDCFRGRDWFYALIGTPPEKSAARSRTSSITLPDLSALKSILPNVVALASPKSKSGANAASNSVPSSPAVGNGRPGSSAPSPQLPQTPSKSVPASPAQQTAQQKYQAHLEEHQRLAHENPYLFKSGMEHQKYSNLQSSLIMNGFSIKKLMEVFNWFPVSSGILPKSEPEENEHVKIQKARLQQRLELYQLKPKREIPSDGNCQMHAISDQLYDSIEHSVQIRKTVVDWLRKNKDWKLPNECVLHQFVHDRTWEAYCDMMAKDGCWGDHLTLLAVSEIFGVTVSVLSSVEGDSFITEIHPTVQKTTKVLLLSHFAEFHYGSLTQLEPPPAEVATPGGPVVGGGHELYV